MYKHGGSRMYYLELIFVVYAISRSQVSGGAPPIEVKSGFEPQIVTMFTAEFLLLQRGSTAQAHTKCKTIYCYIKMYKSTESGNSIFGTFASSCAKFYGFCYGNM